MLNHVRVSFFLKVCLNSNGVEIVWIVLLSRSSCVYSSFFPFCTKNRVLISCYNFFCHIHRVIV